MNKAKSKNYNKIIVHLNRILEFIGNKKFVDKNIVFLFLEFLEQHSLIDEAKHLLKESYDIYECKDLIKLIYQILITNSIRSLIGKEYETFLSYTISDLKEYEYIINNIMQSGIDVEILTKEKESNEIKKKFLEAIKDEYEYDEYNISFKIKEKFGFVSSYDNELIKLVEMFDYNLELLKNTINAILENKEFNLLGHGLIVSNVLLPAIFNEPPINDETTIIIFAKSEVDSTVLVMNENVLISSE